MLLWGRMLASLVLVPSVALELIVGGTAQVLHTSAACPGNGTQQTVTCTRI